MFLLGISLFNNFDGTQLGQAAMAIGAAVCVFIGLRSWLNKDADPNTPGVQRGPWTDLLKDVAGLLTHADSLGLPFLKPIAAAAASGNVLSIPGLLRGVFDSLNNKESRGKILETLFWQQLKRWVEDSDRAKQLLDFLAPIFDRLGYTITKKPSSA